MIPFDWCIYMYPVQTTYICIIRFIHMFSIEYLKACKTHLIASVLHKMFSDISEYIFGEEASVMVIST